ncbi:hypothetical protein GS18_0203400 [Metabacillus indicus]|uniref:Uncharacterized protein n=1 Tax=Metabacillus indicus TaxID=246786 RepID=A0A084H325_METID|nr:hypothetical protein GS18_0203400 [Metabacillus indicus]
MISHMTAPFQRKLQNQDIICLAEESIEQIGVNFIVYFFLKALFLNSPLFSAGQILLLFPGHYI